MVACSYNGGMRAALQPIQFVLLSLAGWISQHQQDVIDYLVEENRVLKEQHKGRALRLTDDQRRRLAAKGKRIGRQALNRVATIVTPDTIMRWHRQLIALKWTFEAKRVGRPGLMKAIKALIVRMATENSGWGYCRIQGELKELGRRVASTTRVRPRDLARSGATNDSVASSRATAERPDSGLHGPRPDGGDPSTVSARTVCAQVGRDSGRQT